MRSTGSRTRKKLTPADEVWHELVLNGVGGSTIAEAKERLSYAEYRAWVAYLKDKRGSLHPGHRLELRWLGSLRCSGMRWERTPIPTRSVRIWLSSPFAAPGDGSMGMTGHPLRRGLFWKT